jgi:hypothetical protein
MDSTRRGCAAEGSAMEAVSGPRTWNSTARD